LERPFYDEEPMVGDPDCSEAAFKRPALRRCPFDLGTISWIARLDGGLDGFAWKVAFGDQGPFVLKVFWETEPSRDSGYYYPFQRECQNAALLEKIAAAVSRDTDKLPIKVHAHPASFEDAMDNLLAFSAEGRQRQQVKDPDALHISSIPRTKKCYGWLNIDGEYLCSLPRAVRPILVSLEKPYGDREIRPDQRYFAIVYEYIPEGENDRSCMQEQLDFLWRAGFELIESFRKENWKSSVLVDLSDIVPVISYAW
ncbi:uncharacterized protein THITE_2016922, partial [Thermothielavioides terrestris NRRL 8126]